MAKRGSKKDALIQECQDLNILIIPGAYYSEDQLNQMIEITKSGGLKKKPAKEETDKQIDTRIASRFTTLERILDGCIEGTHRAVIVSGPAGLGKSFTVEEKLKQYDPSGLLSTIIKGNVRATGLFKQLWDHRLPGQVLVFDDADSIFFDDTSLNLLKAVCDTQKGKRTVSYLSETNFISDKNSSAIPKTFDFEGTIIFITNYDFDECIAKGTRLAPHMEALMSRAHYIDLAMKTRRDYVVRLDQLYRAGLLSDLKIDERKDVAEFIRDNMTNLRVISAREAVKIGKLRKAEPKTWKATAQVTCFTAEAQG